MSDDGQAAIDGAQQGDPDAFGELVRAMAPRVHAIAYRLTGNAEDARDCAQEAFVRLHATLPRWDARARVSTWLYRVTVNLAIDCRRRASRRRQEPLDPPEGEPRRPDTAPGPDALIERRELALTVERLAGDLPDRQREAFILRDLEQFTTSEIAAMLRCRESTVRVHLARARERIRDILTKEYPEFRGGDRS